MRRTDGTVGEGRVQCAGAHADRGTGMPQDWSLRAENVTHQASSLADPPGRRSIVRSPVRGQALCCHRPAPPSRRPIRSPGSRQSSPALEVPSDSCEPSMLSRLASRCKYRAKRGNAQFRSGGCHPRWERKQASDTASRRQCPAGEPSGAAGPRSGRVRGQSALSRRGPVPFFVRASATCR